MFSCLYFFFLNEQRPFMPLIVVRSEDEPDTRKITEFFRHEMGINDDEIWTLPDSDFATGGQSLVEKTEQQQLFEEKIDNYRKKFSNTVKYMRAILDLQQSYIFVLDRDEIIDGNQRFLQTFKYTTPGEMQKDFTMAYRIENNQAIACQELMVGEDWIRHILTHTDESYRVRLEADGIDYNFELSAAGMLYKSGISDDEYEQGNYIVVSMTEISHILDEIIKSREKDFLLIKQSRHAAMGEMLSCIAHQWRQPLNALAINLVNIHDLFLSGEHNLDQYTKYHDRSERILHYMSETINDFRLFFKPSKEKKPFSLKEALKDTMKLVHEQMEISRIKVKLDSELKQEETQVLGFKNEFQQVIVNLLSNARDAIEQTAEKNSSLNKGKIQIEIVEKSEKWLQVQILDNGGGIDEKALPKIFDPYFSTKDERNGTGIGLYMAKMIVEKNMDGKLSAKNKKNGALFTIELKKAK